MSMSFQFVPSMADHGRTILSSFQTIRLCCRRRSHTFTCREVVGAFGSGSRLHDGTVFSSKGRNVYEGKKESDNS